MGSKNLSKILTNWLQIIVTDNEVQKGSHTLLPLQKWSQKDKYLPLNNQVSWVALSKYCINYIRLIRISGLKHLAHLIPPKPLINQIESFAFCDRIEFTISSNFNAVSHLVSYIRKYIFAWGKVTRLNHRFHVDSSLHLRTILFYCLSFVSFNSWINHELGYNRKSFSG